MPTLRTRRRLSVASLALALVASTAPALAALPDQSPTDTAHCADGQAVKVWTEYNSHYPELTRLAAENPCPDRWLMIDWPGQSVSDPYGRTVFLAPGQRFHWDAASVLEWGLYQYEEDYAGIALVPESATCVQNYEAASGWSSYEGLLVYGDDDVKEAPECGQPVRIYEADRHGRAACPLSDTTATVTWKTLRQTLIKLEVRNWCSENWVVAWWRLANGRTVGVWVEPGGAVDLWKWELDAVPTTTKDRRVHLGTDRSLGVDVDEIGRPDPTRRPFYYNGFPAGDTVRCSAGVEPECP